MQMREHQQWDHAIAFYSIILSVYQTIDIFLEIWIDKFPSVAWQTASWLRVANYKHTSDLDSSKSPLSTESSYALSWSSSLEENLSDWAAAIGGTLLVGRRVAERARAGLEGNGDSSVAAQ